MCECFHPLTFAKLLPRAKGLRFVVTVLLVGVFQLVKGRGDIACVEITGFFSVAGFLRTDALWTRLRLIKDEITAR